MAIRHFLFLPRFALLLLRSITFSLKSSFLMCSWDGGRRTGSPESLTRGHPSSPNRRSQNIINSFFKWRFLVDSKTNLFENKDQDLELQTLRRKKRIVEMKAWFWPSGSFTERNKKDIIFTSIKRASQNQKELGGIRRLPTRKYLISSFPSTGITSCSRHTLISDQQQTSERLTTELRAAKLWESGSCLRKMAKLWSKKKVLWSCETSVDLGSCDSYRPTKERSVGTRTRFFLPQA